MTGKCVFWTAAAAVVLVGSAGAQGNLLQNPGFELSPPGYGIADGWSSWFGEFPPLYWVTDATTYPWAVRSGQQSQMWLDELGARVGILQVVTGLTPGETYRGGAFFSDADPAGTPMPTMFRIGFMRPVGQQPPYIMDYVWGEPQEVTAEWQEASLEVEATNDELVMLLVTEGAGFGNRVFVDDASLVGVAGQPCSIISNVPDINPPLKNPLGVPNVNDLCGPISAANITQYWDVVKNDASAAGVNAGLGGATVAPYIGFWMDTNNFGCPYRENGATRPAAAGTYVGDLASGLAQYARWDANNGFGCTSPTDPAGPALPAGKKGYAWTVQTQLNQAPAAQPPQQVWNSMTGEINAGRPLIVTWSYWNPVSFNPPVTIDGVEYCDWGPVPEDSDENWNDRERTQGQGTGTIGHDTTAVGFCANYQPAAHLPKTNWVIVHDNWPNTGRDIAVPWMTTAQPVWSPWVSNVTVSLQAPQVGSLALAAAWFVNPADHYCVPSVNPRNVLARLRLTAGAAEPVEINALTLKASGTGNDKTDILSIDLVDDANNNCREDPGEAIMASGAYPNDDGTVTIQIPGPKYRIAAGATANLLIVYGMNANPSPAVGKTYQCQVTAIYATGAASYQPIGVHGLPYASSKKTIGAILIPSKPCFPLGEWMIHPDGWWGRLRCSPVVSCSAGRLGNVMYLQESDRSAGIRVDFGQEDAPVIPEGMEVEIEAFISTEDGERVLVQPEVMPSGEGPAPVPLTMAARDVGGADWFHDPDTGAGRRGVLNGRGLNNIGLLVRVFGRAIFGEVMPDFWLDDGSGLPLKCVVPSHVEVSPTWQFVTVTGISSCEMMGGELMPVLRVRLQEDIEVLY